jgi:hypothetical protein
VTHEGKHLILQLEDRIERNQKRAEGLRGLARVSGDHESRTLEAQACVAQAWADATRLALDDLVMAVPWIEEDARFAQASGK